MAVTSLHWHTPPFHLARYSQAKLATRNTVVLSKKLSCLTFLPKISQEADAASKSSTLQNAEEMRSQTLTLIGIRGSSPSSKKGKKSQRKFYVSGRRVHSAFCTDSVHQGDAQASPDAYTEVTQSRSVDISHRKSIIDCDARSGIKPLPTRVREAHPCPTAKE